jgi:hypothetical protein
VVENKVIAFEVVLQKLREQRLPESSKLDVARLG